MACLRLACGSAALLICLVLCSSVPARAQLEEGPVPGKEAYEPSPRFSTAIVANGFIYLSGSLGDNSTTLEEQVAEIMTGFNETLTILGSSLDAAVRSTVYLSNLTDFAAMNGAYTPFFTSNPPARSTIGAQVLNGGLIEIDLIALA